MNENHRIKQEPTSQRRLPQAPLGAGRTKRVRELTSANAATAANRSVFGGPRSIDPTASFSRVVQPRATLVLPRFPRGRTGHTTCTNGIVPETSHPAPPALRPPAQRAAPDELAYSI